MNPDACANFERNRSRFGAYFYAGQIFASFAGFSVGNREFRGIIDLDILLLPVHDFLLPWWRYAGMCRKTLAPVCNDLQNLLCDDVERVAQLLSSLECSDEMEEFTCDCSSEAFEDVDSPCSMNIGPENQPLYRERPPHRQHLHSNTPVVISSLHNSTPTIVITPCDTQARDISALVPMQDSAFRTRLTVPCHPKLNHAFPPMVNVVPAICKIPELDWKWSNGHWQALLPGIDEQTSKGIFSRAISRRKVSRRFRIHPTTNCASACRK
ncbi:hypothetical protein J3R30DRAFT_1385151 [Lentinula aciculospora]|uniref:Uncharacterized protein n=1 Tax=Lentinula aciculospora TaxID=153920 RepID=A0A9W9ALC4_9AGAR|nr:hypothetical protein J3R30DRAFT_1385151 [Lentinula aciculospora]